VAGGPCSSVSLFSKGTQLTLCINCGILKIMRRKRVTARLDAMEQRIEDSAAEFRPASKEKIGRIDAILDSTRKTRNINIRISESDLDLKRAAEV
jgi:hypothetical protein